MIGIGSDITKLHIDNTKYVAVSIIHKHGAHICILFCRRSVVPSVWEIVDDFFNCATETEEVRHVKKSEIVLVYVM